MLFVSLKAVIQCRDHKMKKARSSLLVASPDKSRRAIFFGDIREGNNGLWITTTLVVVHVGCFAVRKADVRVDASPPILSRVRIFKRKTRKVDVAAYVTSQTVQDPLATKEPKKLTP